MTVGELIKFLSDSELEDDTEIIISDEYTGAYVKEFDIVKNNSWYINININTEEWT